MSALQTQPNDRWVLIDIVVEYTGYTKDAVYAKKKGSVWTKGRFWTEAPDGRIAFNLSMIQRWMSAGLSSGA